jgi:MFS family permease
MKSEIAMSGGLALLVPSVTLLVLAQSLTSMTVLLLGTAITGVALGMGYRGSLQVVNEMAPADRRAEVVSAYFIACFIGNSVPVIGVGILTSVTNSLVAGITFACTIAAFAIGALVARSRERAGR